MINPGTSEVVSIDPGVGSVESQTLNPLSPVEVGRTVVGGVANDATKLRLFPNLGLDKWQTFLSLQVTTALPEPALLLS